MTLSLQCSSFICCQRHWIWHQLHDLVKFVDSHVTIFESLGIAQFLNWEKCTRLFKNSLELTILTKSYHQNVLTWTRGKCDWVANRGVFRTLHKFLLLATWDYLSTSNFSVSEVRASGVYYTWFMKWRCGMHTKLRGLVWAHQARHYAKHIEKPFLLTRYETPMTLIGYCHWTAIRWLLYNS